ncbi:MAG: hypothetical protein IJN42_08205 [Clostridia bacterium]|nr:hypothetical protein [Clostridia bacterium]
MNDRLWSYAPYRPAGAADEIYICRLAPAEESIHIEWLGDDKVYEIYYRVRGTGDFVLHGHCEKNAYDLDGLQTDTEYEFFVKSQDRKSVVRLARAGKCEGVVVNYLHPEDTAYAFSGHCLASPSLVRLPDGALLASMDVYAKSAPQNHTLIFRSTDEGESWHYLSELHPCFWGKLFLHKGELYMLACSTEFGDLLIGKSTDGGKTFGAPTVIARGKAAGKDGYHRAPQNILLHNGRLYTSYEWGVRPSPKEKTAFTVGVLSCDAASDLLNAENWRVSAPQTLDPAWVPEVTDVTPLTATIEGTMAVWPDGKLTDILRFECAAAKVIAYQVGEDPAAPVQFDRTVDFPAGHSKFEILQDEEGRYYSVATRYFENGERTARSRPPRNLLSLLVSDDLAEWRIARDLIDYRDRDMNKHGFQYVDFIFSGEDILYLCRTATNGAVDFHDSNYITFHRIQNYKK